MSKTGQVGVIGAFDFPVLTRQVEGFRLGARYGNSKIKTLSSFINSWDDAGKAKEATQAQIDAGADIVLAAIDQAARGVFSASDNSESYAIASYADESALAPKALLASVVYDFPKLLRFMIVTVHQGNLEAGKFYRFGLNGYSALIDNPALAGVVPKAVVEKVQALIQDIQEGRIKVPELRKDGDAASIDLAILRLGPGRPADRRPRSWLALRRPKTSYLRWTRRFEDSSRCRRRARTYGARCSAPACVAPAVHRAPPRMTPASALAATIAA